MERVPNKARTDHLSVDMSQLRKVIRKAVHGMESRYGLFRDHDRLLPQLNLPKEITDALDTDEGGRKAANFMFLEAFFERSVASPQIVRACLRAHELEETKWIFDPLLVVEHTVGDIDYILRKPLERTARADRISKKKETPHLPLFDSPVIPPLERLLENIGTATEQGVYDVGPQETPIFLTGYQTHEFIEDHSWRGILDFGLVDGGGRSRMTRAEEIMQNAQNIACNYQGDARRLVDGLTAAQAVANTKMRGIDTIAHLFITYLRDLGLAEVQDPQSTYLKVDTHKGRFPIATSALILDPAQNTTRREPIIEIMEPAYCQACQEEKLDPAVVDRALWLIGTNGCKIGKEQHCYDNCPVYKDCTALPEVIGEQGKLGVYTPQGTRIDARKRGIQRSINHTIE